MINSGKRNFPIRQYTIFMPEIALTGSERTGKREEII
jgi:hypothetical protein